MKIERGCETGGVRLLLTLQSVDTDSHSLMSDNAEYFSLLADHASQAVRDELATSWKIHTAGKERVKP